MTATIDREAREVRMRLFEAIDAEQGRALRMAKRLRRDEEFPQFAQYAFLFDRAASFWAALGTRVENDWPLTEAQEFVLRYLVGPIAAKVAVEQQRAELSGVAA